MPSTEPQRVTLTHPDRVLYAEQKLTKRELAEYLMEVADRMLPHIAHRPLMLLRCPQGREKKCFFQKHASTGLPDPLHIVAVREVRGTRAKYTTVVDAPGLVALAQIGVLEIHVWGSRADDLERPDQIVLDLDPGEGVAFGRVVDAARETRSRLEELGLESFVKTTGGKGLHVVVPLVRRREWDDVKRFSSGVADQMVRDSPQRYTAIALKEERSGKVFIDYLRNARGSTSIAPFSMRAKSGAPVAAPVAWDELNEELEPDAFDVRTLPRRLKRLERDPWEGFFDRRQSLTQAMLRAVES